jgi:hypothetical protein
MPTAGEPIRHGITFTTLETHSPELTIGGAFWPKLIRQAGKPGDRQ